MLIKFQSKNSADFEMFGEVATQLLKLMGTSGSPEGAIDENHVAEALQTLESRLAGLSNPVSAEPANNEDDGDDKEPSIGLATRAVPLLDMLRKAKEDGSYVMWRKS